MQRKMPRCRDIHFSTKHRGQFGTTQEARGGTIFILKNAWDQPVAALAVSYVLPILLLPIALYLIRLRA